MDSNTDKLIDLIFKKLDKISSRKINLKKEDFRNFIYFLMKT